MILYDPISMRILLVPVPEYPIFPDAKEDTDESALQWDISLYKEDGTLEVHHAFSLFKSIFKKLLKLSPLSNASTD